MSGGDEIKIRRALRHSNPPSGSLHQVVQPKRTRNGRAHQLFAICRAQLNYDRVMLNGRVGSSLRGGPITSIIVVGKMLYRSRVPAAFVPLLRVQACPIGRR